MPKFAELEIHLERRDEQAFTVGFRFLAVGDDATRIENGVGIFRPPALRPPDAELDPLTYGAKLSAALFQDPAVGAKFANYRRSAQEKGDGLRVRLVLPPDLQAIRWEALQDPDPVRNSAPLFAGGTIFLSRYLSSISWKPARSRPKANLNALIVVANPKGDFSPTEDGASQPRRLAPIDVSGELARATAALATTGLQPASLVSDAAATAPVATPTALIAKLRPGVDILYLVCHGALIGGEPRLWLEREDPAQPYEPISASDLIRQIGDLPQVPRLIVLASCQSAGSPKAQDSGVLSALGPRLVAEAGVGAVIAMQGNVQMDTIAIFIPEFFRALMTDGQMDRAMTQARGLAHDRNCPDYWMPVLFTRLQNGAIWYEPGFAGDSDPFNWDIFCRFVKTGKCIPIIGPDLAEHIYGSTRLQAQELAIANGFPYTGQDQGDLAKVAQYLCTRNLMSATRGKVRDIIADQFFKNAPAFLPPGTDPSVPALATALAKTESDPLRIAASLNASVYVTASSDPLFEAILAETPLPDGTKKQITPLLMNWRDERRLVDTNNNSGKAIYSRSQTEQFTGDPSPKNPCLYYIFGKRSEDREASWVLTEDDVFDYLIQSSKYDLIPQVVADALGSRSILFLGFSLDDWKFRVLFRMILAIEGNAQLAQFSHVGVQIDPDQSTLADIARAKAYLEDYYKTPNVMRDNLVKPRISIYWGTASDFLRQLNGKLKATAAPRASV